MVEAQEDTAGTAYQLVNFGTAVKAIKQGKRACRQGWNGKGLFIFEQVPNLVGVHIIPKMSSLPQSVKDVLIKRDQPIKYLNQIALVKPNNEVNGWSPSTADALAEDWIILD